MSSPDRTAASRRWACGLIGLVALVGADPAWAQRDAMISGKVSDRDGNPIAGAQISVTSVDRGDTRTLTTDDAGEYSGPGFRPDIYVVTVEAAGFASQQQQVKFNFGLNVVDATLGAPADESVAEVDTERLNTLYRDGYAAYERAVDAARVGDTAPDDWSATRSTMNELIEGLAGLDGDQVSVMRLSAYEALGRAEFALGDLRAAVATYEAMLALNPDSVAAHSWKAQAHTGLQDFEGALPHVRRAAELAPDDAALQYNSGVILLQIGEVREAIAAIERAVELRPEFPLAKKQLAYAYLRLGGEDASYYSRAIEQLQAYLDLAPEAPDRAEIEQMIGALQAQIRQ